VRRRAADNRREGRLDFALCSGVEAQQAHPENAGRRLQISRLALSIGSVFTGQKCDGFSRRHQSVKHFKALRGYFGKLKPNTGGVLGPIETCYEAGRDGISSS
jgi:hypothetical protein